MITSTLVTSVSHTSPTLVFTSSENGAPVGVAGAYPVGQVNAITTMALCNVADPSASNEVTNSVTATIYLVNTLTSGSPDTSTFSNAIVYKLQIPAGETVFFSEERLVLAAGDEIHVGTNINGVGSLAVTVSTLPV